MKFKTKFIIVVLLLLHFLVKGQAPSFYFKQISLQQGLSESTIRDIIEDKRGYMWFGTEDGLNKYDGNKFTVYKNNYLDSFSLSNNHPKVLFNDSKSNLWILTRSGVNIYDHTHDIFYNSNSKKYKALEKLDIEADAIQEDASGNIWIGGNGNSLFKISSLDQACIEYVYKTAGPTQLFLSLVFDQQGDLFVGTRAGLLKFNTRTKAFSELQAQSGPADEINDLFMDKSRNLWMGTNKGLKMLDAKGVLQTFTHNDKDPFSIIGSHVRDIVLFKDGNLLVGVDGSGIDYMDIHTNKFYHYTQENSSQLNCNNITALYLDSKNDLWAGTYLNGINYSNASSDLFVFTQNNLYSSTNIRKGIVTNFTKDSDGTLWIATDGGGLFSKKTGEENYTHYGAGKGSGGLSSNILISVLYHEGDIWSSTYDGGLNRFNIETKKNTCYRHDINNKESIAGDRLGPLVMHEGKLWIAVDNFGADELDIHTGKFTHHPANWNKNGCLPSGWIISLLNDKKGNLWLGTDEGLCKYDQAKNNFIKFDFSTNFYNKTRNYISDIIEDKEGRLWIGTSGSGVIRYDKNREKYRVYTTADGLSSDNIRILCEDNFSKIWMGTINGITEFDPVTGKGTGFTIKDGITNSSFYYRSKFKNNDGKIFFGSSKGYQVIDPIMAKINERIPPVVLTQLKISNQQITFARKGSPLTKHINYQKRIVLDYDENVIGFEFAALNFNNPDKNKFSYKLEGFDKKWSKPDHQKYAHYTNLNPGLYTFRVIGSNNDEIWNKKGAEIIIEIKPPYWNSWWFYLIECVIVFGILLLVYLWRVKTIHTKNRELEEVIRKRTRELKDSNEQLETFVYKASHDIKGPLKSIIGLTTIGMKDVKDPAALSYFEHILRSTEKLDKLLLELLELTKVNQAKVKKEKVVFEDIIKDSLASFQHLPNYKKIIFKVEITQNADFYTDQNLLYSIIQNLIENPIKYLDPAKSTNYLTITVVVNEKEALLKFEDNGLGIAEDLIEKCFDMFFKVNSTSDGTGLGLYLVKTAVDKLGGKVWVESALGKGSTFHVQFKKNKVIGLKQQG